MTEERAAPDRTPLLVTLALLMAAGATYVHAQRAPGVDFFQYWVVAEASREGTAGLYAPETRGRLAAQALREARSSGDMRRMRAAGFRKDGIEIFSTPFLYTLFRLGAGGGSYDEAYLRYQALSLVAGLAALWMLGQLLGFGPLETALLVLVVAFFEPYQSEVEVANVNRLQLLALAGFLALRSPGQRAGSARPWLAGGVLGLLVAFKPNAGFAVALLFASRVLDGQRRLLLRELGGAALGGALALAVSALTLGGVGGWLEWPHAVAELFTTFDTVPVARGNFSLVQMLREAVGMDTAGLLPALVALGTLAVLVLARARGAGCEPSDARLRDALVLGVGSSGMLLASRLAWLHYFLVSVLIFLAVVASGSRRGEGVRSWLAAAALLALSLIPFRVAGTGQPELAAWMVTGGNLALLLLGMGELLGLSRGTSGAAKHGPAADGEQVEAARVGGADGEVLEREHRRGGLGPDQLAHHDGQPREGPLDEGSGEPAA